MVSRWLTIMSLLVLLLLLSASSSSFALQERVRVSNLSPVQGELLLIEVKDLQDTPQGFFGDDPLLFRKHQERYIALYGISYWLNPGIYVLQIEGEEIEVRVQSGQFSESRIIIDSKKQELIRPNPEDETIIRRREEDRRLISEALATSAQEILWSGPFIWPAEGRITTGFGETRFVNDELTGRHSGIDIASIEGTLIRASNHGEVRLSQDLLVTGLTIIIDHGWGIFSSYSHLSRLNVERGEMVEKGEIIGLMGSTGFSTGSHLHWVIRTRASYLDPERFVKGDPLDLIHRSYEERDALFLVRVGSSTDFQGATTLLNELRSLGFEGFILQKREDRFMVQVGAFAIEENAKNLYKQLQSLGFSPILKSEGSN